jgi:DNA-binding winged helix-turn-helix (wHTH) protein
MGIFEGENFDVGGWRVSPEEGTVSRDGRSERLEPLAMKVLVYLASRAGEPVSRAELEREVWRGMAVGHDAVTSTVTKLRRALRDDARNPRYIATVPKRGYRLTAPVSAEPVAQQSHRAKAERSAPQHAAGLSDRAKVTLLLLILAAIALMAWGLLARLVPSTDEIRARQATGLASVPSSIVVLPLQNLSDDPRQEHPPTGSARTSSPTRRVYSSCWYSAA